MRYVKASTGRVFLVKFEHEDDFLEEVRKLVIKEHVSFATIIFLGALSRGDIVTGPKEVVTPAVPTWLSFCDGREVLGFGTILSKKGEVSLHIHTTFGKGDKAVTGCLRKNAEVFITVEAVVTELKDIRVSRDRDENIGHDLLAFK